LLGTQDSFRIDLPSYDVAWLSISVSFGLEERGFPSKRSNEAPLAGLSRKSDTAAAIRYALSRWRALSRYLEDGQH
jgi:hypothetical protein